MAPSLFTVIYTVLIIISLKRQQPAYSEQEFWKIMVLMNTRQPQLIACKMQNFYCNMTSKEPAEMYCA